MAARVVAVAPTVTVAVLALVAAVLVPRRVAPGSQAPGCRDCCW
ncbi:hypothetical protein ABH935_003952 [Catenulispora sp. GAS73]